MQSALHSSDVKGAAPLRASAAGFAAVGAGAGVSRQPATRAAPRSPPATIRCPDIGSCLSPCERDGLRFAGGRPWGLCETPYGAGAPWPPFRPGRGAGTNGNAVRYGLSVLLWASPGPARGGAG